MPVARRMSRRRVMRGLRLVVTVVVTVAMLVMIASRAEAATAAPGEPDTPQQQSGTAAGRHHHTGSALVAGADGNDPVPPSGAAPEYRRHHAAHQHVPATADRTVTHTKHTEPRVTSKPASPRGDELMRKRTARTSVFANPDGTRTKRIYSRPVHFRTSDGGWSDIDTTLVAQHGRWEQKANTGSATLADSAVAEKVMSLDLGAGESIGFGIADAKDVTGKVSGSTITYPDVRQHADLKYVATAGGGVKESIVLKDDSAPRTWVFPLHLHGLSATVGKDGAVLFTDDHGRVVRRIAHGFMRDSNIGKHSHEGEFSNGVTYSLTTVDSHRALRVTADADWLDDPNRVYPVTVDPSVSSLNTSGSTYVMSPYRNDYSGGSVLDVGTYDGGGHVANAYLKFNVRSALRNEYIESVSLNMDETWSYSCSPRPVYVAAITSGWSVGGLKTYPWVSHGGALAHRSFAAGHDSSCGSSRWEAIVFGSNPDAAGTKLVRSWAHGGTNNGLAVYASSSDNYGWKKFASKNSSNPPYLSITYSHYGASYSVAGGYTAPTTTDSGSQRVTITNKGSATWTPGNESLSYRLYDMDWNPVGGAATTPVPHNVGPNQTVTMTGTIGAISPGSYRLCWDMHHGSVSFNTGYGVPTSRCEVVSSQNVPPAVTSQNPASHVTLGSLTPELHVSAIDPDSYPGGDLTYHYRVFRVPADGGDPVKVADSGDQESALYTVPDEALSWNKAYYWTVAVDDSVGSSDWSEPSYFSTTVPQPIITSHMGKRAGDEHFDPGVGDFTTTASDATVNTAGPSLGIERWYNSQDPRTSGLFGAGWSSRYDMAAVPDADGTGNVVVTYPDGHTVRFGANADGSFTPPQGMYATLAKRDGGGYDLTVRGGTSYRFARQVGAVWKLTRITNAAGREQQLAYDESGRLVTITNTAAGRSLHLTFSGAHVATVTTDKPSPDGAALRWTYHYDGDALASVCPPTPGDGCTQYTYTSGKNSGSHYRSSILDAHPYAYWPLGDDQSDGQRTAQDLVATNLGTKDGTYGTWFGHGPGPIPGSPVKSAYFGANNRISLPDHLLDASTHLTVQLWLKSSGGDGVLFSTEHATFPDPDATGASMPVLYIGDDGKLYGHFWNGKTAPIVSDHPVNDSRWHRVTLVGLGDTQHLYLDGKLVGSEDGVIRNLDPKDMLGAGYVSDRGWPHLAANTWSMYQGALAQAVVYHHPLGAPAIAAQYAAGVHRARQLTSSTTPRGVTSRRVSYDAVTARATAYTDGNGGIWKIGTPKTSDSSDDSDTALPVSTVTVTDPGNANETYTYDPGKGGRLTAYTDGLGNTTSYSYDTNGFGYTATKPDGDYVTTTHDRRGNVLSRTVGDGEGHSATSYRSYPEPGTYSGTDPRDDLPLTSSTANSAGPDDATYRTGYTYSTSGNRTSVTDPLGELTTKTYTDGSEPAVGGGTEPTGLLASATDQLGYGTSYAYDKAGDLATVTNPAGATTTYTYDRLGRKLSRTVTSDSFPDGVTTTYTWGAGGRKTSTTGPATTDAVTGTTHTPRVASHYNADDLVVSKTISDTTGGDEPRTTTYGYNDHDQRTSVTDPVGRKTTYGYGPYGHVTSKITPSGNHYAAEYDANGNRLSMTLVNWTGNPNDPSDPEPLVLESLAYDPEGLLASTTDSMGRTRTYTYDYHHLLRSVVLESFTAHEWGTRYLELVSKRYDPAGNLTDVYRAGGEETVYEYGRAGRATRARHYTNDARGPYPAATATAVSTAQSKVNPNCACGVELGGVERTVDFAYDGAGQVLLKTLSGGGQESPLHINFGYGPLGNPMSKVVHDGDTDLVTEYGYDDLGRRTALRLPNGSAAGRSSATTAYYRYDAAGNLTYITNPKTTVDTPDGGTTQVRSDHRIGYDAFGEKVAVSDPDGNITSYTYDADGERIGVSGASYTPPGRSEPLLPTTSMTYTDAGLLKSLTDPKGNTTRFTYDQLGNRVKTVGPEVDGDSPVTRATYDTEGDRLSVTGPTGARQEATYDKLGERLTATHIVRQPTPVAATTHFWYDPFDNPIGEPKTITRPGGQQWTRYVDGHGRPELVVDALGNQTRYHYDLRGNRTETDLPDGTSTTADYDTAGRKLSTSTLDADGNTLATTTFGYDPTGNRVSVTDPDGVTRTVAYNALNRRVGRTQPVSDSEQINVHYGYDSAGNNTSFTSGNGNITRYTYNSLGKRESEIQPPVDGYTSAADRTTTWTYDASGRTTRIRQPGGVTESLAYDAADRLVTRTGSGAEVSTKATHLGYDQAGRLTSVSAGTGTDTFTYDDRGKLLSADGPSGHAMFSYDINGDVVSRTDAAGTATFGYDPAGRLASLTDPQTGVTASYTRNALGLVTDVSHGSGSVSRSYSYDDQHRLAEQTLSAPDGTTLASISYGYDKAGHLTNSTTTGTAGAGAEGYVYDDAGRLVSWSHGDDTVAYGYDADGNRTRAGPDTAEFNARDQLVSSGDTTYTYTARGTRATRTVDGSTTRYGFDAFGRMATAGKKRYSYDGLDRRLTAGTAEFAYAGTSNLPVSDGIQTYTRDPSGGLVSEASAGTARLAWANQHGDVTGLVVPDGADLAGSTAYTPYGTSRAHTGTESDLGFQGGWTDPDTGQVGTASRWYDPPTGAFTSRDTLDLHTGPMTGANRYAYGAGDPVDHSDPTGHCIWCAVLIELGIDVAAHLIANAIFDPGRVAGSTMSVLGPTGPYGPFDVFGPYGPYARQGPYAYGIPGTGGVRGGHRSSVAASWQYDPQGGGGSGSARVVHRHVPTLAEIVARRPFETPDNPRPSLSPEVPPDGVWLPDCKACGPGMEPTNLDTVEHTNSAAEPTTYHPDTEEHSDRNHLDDANIAYRTIRPDEDPAAGLRPKNPEEGSGDLVNDLNNHIAHGSTIQTRLISATRSLQVANKWAKRKSLRIVKINLDKIDGEYYDFTEQGTRDRYLLDEGEDVVRGLAELTADRAQRFSRQSSEVVIDGYVPASAIIGLVG